MPRAARSSFASLAMVLSACTRPPEHAPERPEHRPEAATAPAPAPAAELEPAAAAPRHCTVPAGAGDEQRALAAWLARNPAPEGFTCPPALRVVQREPWHVSDFELVPGVTDDVASPTRRTVLGGRVFFGGIDPASGDSLTASLARLDEASWAAVKQRLADTAEGDVDPDFEEDERRLDGPWRGLNFAARPAATARKLSAWLAELPAGSSVESYPIGWDIVIGDEELATLPRLVHVRNATVSVLCVEAASKRGCWSTSPVEIDEAMPGLRVGKDDESRDDENGESADDRADAFAPMEMTVWTGHRLEVWALDAAGRWTVVGSANSRRGRPRPLVGDRRFEPATLAPFRGEFAALWVRSLTAEWIVAGEYGDGSQGQVPDATWIFRRLPSGWQFSALDGDDVRDHLIWPDGQMVGLVLGSHERPGGDGLAYADGRLTIFVAEGEGLRPAGRLPLPVRGMAMLRSEGGWEYEYSLAPRPPRCLAVNLVRSLSWQTSDFGRTRRKSPLRLPMASLKGSWSLGPEGLAPGC
ncbi:hypothetical protein [Nannocystis bainbridge]|uniref:Lipoprotein n=1 Tax=Nannocystis bainbridge TaxID=2995303 RepID=A0ABT5E2V5_9BACT|nr:hypothetical protein [Nannocystis bainbridge]MDC0719087.1 hypothetical protein [Nannocystis bainbridge]